VAALPFLPAMAWWLAAAYLAANLGQSLAVLPLGKWHWFPSIMGLIFLSHILYGLGFWRGCARTPRPPPPTVAAAVQLEKIQ